MAKFGSVTGRFVTFVVDSADAGNEPDLVPLQGTVTFQLNVLKVIEAGASPGPQIIASTPFVAVLDEQGYLSTPQGSGIAYRGINLVSNDDPGLNPLNTAYNVTYNLRNGATLVPLTPHQIYVPTSPPVDLSNFIPPEAATPKGTAQSEALAARAVNTANSAARVVIVVTGNEARPEDAISVFWLGGTTRPVRMQNGDIWWKELSIPTPTDPVDPVDPVDPPIDPPLDPPTDPPVTTQSFTIFPKNGSPFPLVRHDDAKPNIEVATGFYGINVAGDLLTKIRLFVPSGGPAPESIRFRVYHPQVNEAPTLGSNIFTEATLTNISLGTWNEVTLNTPLVMENGRVVWVSYDAGDGIYYAAANAIPEPGPLAGLGSHFYLADYFPYATPSPAARNHYRIGTGATMTQQWNWYGLDIMLEVI